jgi:hydrogenase expression/formation protein HypE
VSEEVVTPAHGAGAKQTRDLVDRLVADRFDDADLGPEAVIGLAARDDGAVLSAGEGEVVVTTDSHVVDPPVFPGGDLGTLAVAGTVNDLAVMGATEPLGLTVGLVVEAGTPVDELDGVVASMAETCRAADCPVVAGDTKVMGSGEVDGVVVNTTGVGRVSDGPITRSPRPGDAVVVSGTVGDHGIALLAEREGFDFESPLESDVAPVNELVRLALDAGEVTGMTDPTRGGFATALHELIGEEVGMTIREREVPVDGTVDSAGELLGIDPMQVACEGRVVATVASEDAEAVRAAMAESPLGRDAAIVGKVTDTSPGRIVLDTGLGQRYLQEPSGRTLPRIC